jgi:hypothetical protein
MSPSLPHLELARGYLLMDQTYWLGPLAILIAGRSFSGNTTLAAELVRAGATYYSDEFKVVDSEE